MTARKVPPAMATRIRPAAAPPPNGRRRRVGRKPPVVATEGGTGANADPGGSGLPQVTRVFAAIVAPTTLVTSLLFYFGWMYVYWYFDYFGVHSTLLGLTTTDYIMQTADALFVPM